MSKVFASDWLNFEFLRLLGTAPSQGSDVAECLEVAAKIKENDPESWYKAWTEAAEKAEEIGESALESGDKETAKWAFMRSSNYRRSSEYLLHENPDDPRLLAAITKSVDNFKIAYKLLDSPVETLEIPYEKTNLPAYLFLPKADTELSGKTPVIINTGGYDSTQEEIYHFTAAGARLRGYATLTFEGPGQGIVLRRDKVYMRGDWEVVISAVLDQLFHSAEEHPEWNLDLSKVAIVGNSMGSYFALRGALDPRIKACICSDGLYDFGAAGRERTPFFMKYLSPQTADAVLRFVLQFDFRTRCELYHGAFAFGSGSLTEAVELVQTFTLSPPGRRPIPEDITCPVLVTFARDSVYRLEAERVYNSLTQLSDGRTKQRWDPETVGSGSYQAKVGALSHLHARVIGFLDEVFEIKRQACV